MWNVIDMQTSIDDNIFLEVSRSSCFPLILIGVHRKGQAFGQVILLSSWVFPMCKWVTARPSLRLLLIVFTIVFPTKKPRVTLHVPFHMLGGLSAHWRVSHDYKSLVYKKWCVQAPNGKRYTNLTKPKSSTKHQYVV